MLQQIGLFGDMLPETKSAPTPHWTVCAEIDVVYKTNVKNSERPLIRDSRSIYELLLANWNLLKLDYCEQFKVLFLNRNNRVLGLFNASSGGMTGTVADPRMILGAAVKSNACSMVLSHNHPSGNLRPSNADEDLTAKIKTAAAYFDIKVLDHIIMTSEGYFSFADEGYL